MKAKPVAVGMEDGKLVEMLPVLLKPSIFLPGIQWGRLGSVAQAMAKSELVRMLQVYERFNGWLQPLMVKDGKGHTIWEVRFPNGARWKDGPKAAKSWEAVRLNYNLNKGFPGYMDSTRGNPDSVNRLEQIKAAALKADEEHRKGVQGEASRIIETARR